MPTSPDKKCSKCKIEKPLGCFNKAKNQKSGYRPDCKACKKIVANAYNDRATQEIIEKRRLATRKYTEANKELVYENKNSKRREYRDRLKEGCGMSQNFCRVYFKTCLQTGELFATRTKAAKYSPEGWKMQVREKQKEEEYKIKKRVRRRVGDQKLRKENPMFRLRGNITRAINQSLNHGKGRRWELLLGYTLEELKIHLQDRFKPGMTWENYGKFGWHIDHIKPVSAHSFETVEDVEFKTCWALNNLQPLWWHENLKKGDKYESDIAA